MSSALRRGVIRLFHPAQHLWLKAVPLTPDLLATNRGSQIVSSPAVTKPNTETTDHLFLEFGLTERGLEDVGDMTGVQNLFPTVVAHGTNVRRGENLMRLEWEGHSITSADELYHTVWETFEGETSIKSPVAGTIEAVMDCDTEALDDETVLVRMTTTRKNMEEATREEGLMRDMEYSRMLHSIKPGKFAE